MRYTERQLRLAWIIIRITVEQAATGERGMNTTIASAIIRIDTGDCYRWCRWWRKAVAIATNRIAAAVDYIDCIRDRTCASICISIIICDGIDAECEWIEIISGDSRATEISCTSRCSDRNP